MKEALERIRQAEIENEKKYQQAAAEIKRHQQQKEQELQELTAALKIARIQKVNQVETEEQQQLQNEKELLLADAKQKKAAYREQYEAKHEQIVGEILERVKTTYGS
ncbi:hypothetical protein [Enterococcus massiliensis]|uniref:hypothetical protein n=1 Tax=Enterococcus massiliensis TaxID=1640685 RepID=UPI00065DFEB8|nr:hypothetical protein [Enterococcus massiliensis]